MKTIFLSIVFTLAVLVNAPATAGIIQFSANLDGASESPPNASPGTGTALITFDTDAQTMRVQASFADLIGTVTAAHIHCCTAIPGAGNIGVATQTPSFLGFPLGVTAGSYDNTFDLTNPASFNGSFVTANGGTAAGAMAALLAGAQDGRAYFNIHTSFRTAGEIRGFLVPIPSTLWLMGAALAGWCGVGRRRKLPS